MNFLSNLIGVEAPLPEVTRAIRGLAVSFNLPVVGAVHVTCSDETESECAEAFDQGVAKTLLPALKPDHRAALRTMNLGGRYERGSVHVAEEHFAPLAAPGSAKLVVVKINSHVAARATPDGMAFGTLLRYGAESHCCGALAAMFERTMVPAIGELQETFRAEGIDRLAMLRDRRVRPAHRALLAAVAGARLQAARAASDIAARQPSGPTLFLVVPCVTINRTEADTEIVVGQYGIDATTNRIEAHYRGLGDVPLAYRLAESAEGVFLEDDLWPESIEPADSQGQGGSRGLGDVPPGYRLDNTGEGVDLHEDRARGWGL